MGIKYLPQGRLTTGEREHAPRHLVTAYTVIFFTPTGQKKDGPDSVLAIGAVSLYKIDASTTLRSQ